MIHEMPLLLFFLGAFLAWGILEYYLPSEIRLRRMTFSERAAFLEIWNKRIFSNGPMIVGVDSAKPGSDER